jgi:V-type H+-transporting ATPase subunit d
MAELMFNMDDGYFEGLVRGFRSGILVQADYMNLCQCETLDGACSLLLFDPT